MTKKSNRSFLFANSPDVSESNPICPECGGSGAIHHYDFLWDSDDGEHSMALTHVDECHACFGTGFMPEEKRKKAA
jgi:hypothetical protein